MSANVTGAGVASGDSILIAGNGRGIKAQFNTGGTVLVQNNVVDTPSSTQAQVDTLYSQGSTGTSNIVFQNNVATVNNTDPSGHSDAFQSQDDTTLTVRNNVMLHPNGGVNNHGVIISDIVAGGLYGFYNNVIAMGFTPGSQIGLAETAIFRQCATSGFTGAANFFNNTIYGGFTGIIYNQTGCSVPANEAFKNNLIYLPPLALSPYDLSGALGRRLQSCVCVKPQHAGNVPALLVSRHGAIDTKLFERAALLGSTARFHLCGR
jgi:hypothetical protein